MKVSHWNKRTVRPTDWLASNVPEGKLVADLDLIPDGLPYREVVKGYVANFRGNVEAGKGLILWGPYRSGKSCIAAAFVREALAHRLDAFWIDSFDVADAWIGRRGAKREAIRGCQFLVIDDLGTESHDAARGEFPREKIMDLLRYRLERLRPVVITTNLSPDEVRKIYGDKMWALLQEYMRVVLVRGAEDFWKSRR